MRHRFRLLTSLRETAPVLATVLAVLSVIGVTAPAAAQFNPFPFFDVSPAPQRRSGGGMFGGGNDAPYFAPFQQTPRRSAPAVREDYSKAPAPEKRPEIATPPERNIVVVGDAMADWLGYGLEDAYSERPDIGIVRRSKTYSGLIRYQPKGDPADWPSAVKSVLANDNPAAVVVMLGLTDRIALREIGKKPADAKPNAKPSDKPDTEQADDAEVADPAPITTPEKGSRSTSGTYEFREEKWAELYTKKIEEMIAAVKAKGAPVVWVGLPAVRGAKATADMLYLNALYRDAAQKAGITFVDVWDGFVDEAGRFMQQGPDFEGQTRRLRSYDGVYFTKAGARKLAHYTEREINRVLASRSAPLELPPETDKPEVEPKPGSPQSNRPLAGPIVPLTVATVASDQLMGGPSPRPVAVNQQIARAVTKGEALTPPPGRADDGSWPRREVGREIAPKGGDMPEMASTTSSGANTSVTPVMIVPAQPGPTTADPQAQARRRQKLILPQTPQQANAGGGGGGGLDFFGFGSVAQPQPSQPQQPQQRQQQAQPAYPQQPRQVRAPSIFGQSSPFQGNFFSR